jgi:hypothetical protein
MFWSHPKPWAKTIALSPLPRMTTLLRCWKVILNPVPRTTPDEDFDQTAGFVK